MDTVQYPVVGQRVEVLLHRGTADEWMAGTVDEDGRVVLDENPPGMTRSAGISDIADWRAA